MECIKEKKLGKKIQLFTASLENLLGNKNEDG
jgi:hypothetical protein